METPKEMHRLLKIKEVAELLGVHPVTLRRWDKNGILKAVRIGVRGHLIRKDGDVGDRRYRREDVEKIMNS